MDGIVLDTLKALELGEPQIHENMVVYPLFVSSNGGPEYVTLPQALKDKSLEVTEVTEGGHVPNLKVISQSELPILLLDSEELIGARQNRVLNTSILIPEKAETVIPVSCVEQGRWAYYGGSAMGDSGHVSTSKLRYAKGRAVTHNLEMDMGYASDQGEVWEEVGETLFSASVSSPSAAMHDVFDSREDKMKAYVEAFKAEPKQRGLLVLVNGEVVGMDVLSREEAYASLHEKLVKGYALDAALDAAHQAAIDSDAETKGDLKETAESFVHILPESDEKVFDSVGYGKDYRYTRPETVGSALVHEDRVVHAAFFRETGSHKARREAYRARFRRDWPDDAEDGPDIQQQR